MIKKKLKPIVVISLFLFSWGKLNAQQDFFMSQSFVNPSMINPSLTAIQDGPEFGLFNRYQWLGSESTPNTQQLIFSTTYNKPAYLKSAYKGGALRRGKKRSKGGLFHVFNASIINDRAGAFSKLETRFHWSPQVRIGKDIYAGLGPVVSFSRFQLDPERLSFKDGTDVAWGQIQKSGLTNSSANISFCGNVHSQNFYFGAAFLDALNQSWNRADSSGLLVDRNLIINGSYRYNINQLFSVSAAGVTRFTFGSPIDHSISFRGIYNNLVWLGFGYRSSKAMNISFGAHINQRFNIVYTAEKSFLGVTGVGLTHEFYLAYILPTRKGSKF